MVTAGIEISNFDQNSIYYKISKFNVDSLPFQISYLQDG